MVGVSCLDYLPNKSDLGPVVLLKCADTLKPFIHRILRYLASRVVRIEQRLNHYDHVRKRRELTACRIHGVEKVLVLRVNCPYECV